MRLTHRNLAELLHLILSVYIWDAAVTTKVCSCLCCPEERVWEQLKAEYPSEPLFSCCPPFWFKAHTCHYNECPYSKIALINFPSLSFWMILTMGRIFLMLPLKSCQRLLTSSHLIIQVYTPLIKTQLNWVPIRPSVSTHSWISQSHLRWRWPEKHCFYSSKEDYLKFISNLTQAEPGIFYCNTSSSSSSCWRNQLPYLSNRIIISNYYFVIIKSSVSWSNLRVKMWGSLVINCLYHGKIKLNYFSLLNKIMMPYNVCFIIALYL